MDNWFIITFYKNNFELLEPFVRFYQERWGIKKFYFLITVTDQNIEIHLERIKKLNLMLGINIEYHIIHTEPIIAVNEWGQIKRNFFSYLQEVVPAQYTKVLSIDNDEFYYVFDNLILKNGEKLHFHFIEFIPHEHFDSKKDFTWSLQGWFYRVNYFKRSSDEERNSTMSQEEVKKLERDTLKNSQNISDGVTHQWCKLVRFNRDGMLYPWDHEDGGYLCGKLKGVSNINDIKNILHKNYFCFHIGVSDRQYFLEKKTRWINPVSGNVTIQVGDIVNDQNSYFNKYYLMSPGIKFKDNFLQQFFK